MIINNNQNSCISYTARVPQIRDGEWACHVINEQFTHFSTSKFKPLFQKKLRNFCGSWLIPQKPISIDEIIHNAYLITESHKKDKSCIKKFIQKIAKPFLPKRTERDYQIIEKIVDKIEELGHKRMKCGLPGKHNEVYEVLKLITEHHLGNCYENAVIAELVLKLNGIKNARTLFIKNKDSIEHCVCAFNKDKSPLEEITNNKTIIIDPWAQKTDFVNNMMIYLKNNFGNNLSMGKKLNYEIHEFVKLYPTEIEKFKYEYPALVFNSKSRKFMESN